MESLYNKNCMSQRITGTHEKALQINLDRRFYGTFAEIGAGQEVARWFFRVGGAAGTVAKTISAYDMAFSDAIYGKGERYVSQNRLQNMLDHEYGLLIERLNEKRGKEDSFFALANTVAARNFQGTNECHGWMGIKFQLQPLAEPNYIEIHVNMLDKENLKQQEALGIIGVNLVYGAFFLHGEPELLIESLLDSLSNERIEVDMIRFIGPFFRNLDNRLMALQLVEQGLSNAALLAANGDVYQPSEFFHKKPILIERGSFRPITNVTIDMLGGARKQFQAANQGKEIIEVFEITTNNLLASGIIDHRDFLARAELIHTEGKAVLISNYAEYYRLAAYLWRYTQEKIGIVMGIPNLREIFNEKYYEKLDGGILESFGRLFKNGLKLYVYPAFDSATDTVTTVDTLEVAPNLRNLYKHLTENGDVEGIKDFKKEFLIIYSRNVLSKIHSGDSSWETMVPAEVASLIKEKGFFGYKAKP